MSSVESQQAAIALARAGDVPGARTILLRLGAATPGAADPWLTLASIERHVGDAAAERAALFEALRRAPRHLGALLARGELERRIGDDRAAVRFFTTALKAAAANGAPPQLHAALNEAQRFAAEVSERFAATLTAAVTDAGVDRVSPRVAEAIDLLLGRKQLYVQQPSMFYFPGTAQRAVFSREDFDWVSEVEAATDEIKRELIALLAGDDAFAPYVRSDPNAPPPSNHLLDSDDWGALHLFLAGKPHPDNAARCPATMAALAKAPMPVIGGRSPMALFSRLKPGAHIKPHHGVLNTRLICHLPLIVPDGCGIRVGAETRAWREGELLIFDDSFEHEAWNRGSADRIVLLFEVWRPDIDDAERAAITALLESVQNHGALDDAED
jgi:aspartyl/asparaginyl beta-hydroxylase (cupin superfamily)